MDRRTFLKSAIPATAAAATWPEPAVSQTAGANPAGGRLTIEAPYLLAFKDGKHEVVHDAYVTMDGGRIGDISSSRPAAPGTLIRASGQDLVMPGLIDSHSHTTLASIVRGQVEDGWTDANTIWLPFLCLGKMDSQEQIDALNEWAAREVLRSGTTTIVDEGVNLRHGRAFAKAAQKVGNRAYVCPSLPGFPRAMDIMFRWDNETLEKSTAESEAEMDEMVSLIRSYNSRPDARVRFGFGPMAPPDIPLPLLKRMATLAQELDCLLAMHFAEQGGGPLLKQMSGKTPLPYLKENGILDQLKDRLILSSGGPTTDEENRWMVEAGASLTFDEFSHLYRSASLPSYIPKKKAGIRLAMCSNSLMLDLIEQMKWMAYLTQLAEKLIAYPIEEDVIEMATLGGAQALRRPDLGRLEKGARADIIIVKLGRWHNGPMLGNPLRHLVRYSSGADVDTVIVDGKVVVRNGQFQVAVDPEVASVAGKAKAQIWKALEPEIAHKRYPGMSDNYEEWQQRMRRKTGGSSEPNR